MPVVTFVMVGFATIKRRKTDGHGQTVATDATAMRRPGAHFSTPIPAPGARLLVDMNNFLVHMYK